METLEMTERRKKARKVIKRERMEAARGVGAANQPSPLTRKECDNTKCAVNLNRVCFGNREMRRKCKGAINVPG